jgi:hypothetical protein
MVTISALVIILNVAETATAAAAMESDIIVTGIANGTGIEIGMTRVGYAYGGQGAKATIPRRGTVMTETGGRSGWIAGAGVASWSVTGMAIGNHRGDASASVGQAGTHEDLNTEEGMQDDLLAACASSSEMYTYASLFSIIDYLRYGTVHVCPAGQTALDTQKDYAAGTIVGPGKSSRSSAHHNCLPSLSQGRIGAFDTKLPT